MAVAISASAMPGATMASVACCTPPSATKALMMPHTVPNRPTYGLVEPMVARLASPSSMRSSSLSWPTRMARRAPSNNWSGGMPLCLRRANSRKPNSKMLDMPVAPPRLSICRSSVVRSTPFQKLSSKFSASPWARDSSARLRKMMVQETSDASISRPMTTCTGMLASSTNRTIDSSVSILDLCGLDEIGQGARLERFGVDTHHADFALGEQGVRTAIDHARNLLAEADRGASLGHRNAGHEQVIIESRGLAVFHAGLRHGEYEAILVGDFPLRVPETAQPFGARAFHELEVV